jgi:hypothetical protein
MDGENTRTFQKTGLFKCLVILFIVFLTLLIGCFFILAKPNLFMMIGSFVLILIVALSFLAIASEKIIVTSDAIVRENIFKNRVISFKTIKLIKIGRIRQTYLLYIFTEQAQIALSGGATQKQLHEMMQYILEKIRLNDPEHYESINSRQNEVENFWRK